MGWRRKSNAATVEFEVKWRGYSEEWATFETFESMIQRPDTRGKVRAFLKREVKKKDNPFLQEKLDQLEAMGSGATSGSQKLKGPFAGRERKERQGEAAVDDAPARKVKKKLAKKDKAVVGARVHVYWVAMKEWFNGTITFVDPGDGSTTVKFDDGDELTYPAGFQGFTWKLGDFKR